MMSELMKFLFHKKIKIKYHAPITELSKIEIGDWIDLYAAEKIELRL